MREQDKLKYLYLASVRRTITITVCVTAVANGITRKKEIGWMMNNTFFRFLSSFIKKDDKCNVIECNNFNRVVKFQQVGVYTRCEIVTHHEKSSIHFNFKITEVRPWNAIDNDNDNQKAKKYQIFVIVRIKCLLLTNGLHNVTTRIFQFQWHWPIFPESDPQEFAVSQTSNSPQ